MRFIIAKLDRLGYALALGILIGFITAGVLLILMCGIAVILLNLYAFSFWSVVALIGLVLICHETIQDIPETKNVLKYLFRKACGKTKYEM